MAEASEMPAVARLTLAVLPDRAVPRSAFATPGSMAEGAGPSLRRGVSNAGQRSTPKTCFHRAMTTSRSPPTSAAGMRELPVSSLSLCWCRRKTR